MCCVCEGSTLDYRNTYWYPYQWDRAVVKALWLGKTTNRKYKVHKQTFSNGAFWGWKIKAVD